jgi:hypothetical protein
MRAKDCLKLSLDFAGLGSASMRFLGLTFLKRRELRVPAMAAMGKRIR